MAEAETDKSEVDNQREQMDATDNIWKVPMWDERMSLLINNELMSDVTFVVKEKRYAAHKFVLAFASEVFHAMFYGPLADDRKEIEIVDCERPEDFLEFLSLIYVKSAEVTWKNVKQLSYLRKKYMILETGPFVNFITSKVNSDSVLNALEISVSLEEGDMIEECLKVIRRDISVLVQTEQFLKLNQPSIKLILKQDMLNIKEIDLFNAVDKWCSYQVEEKKIHLELTTKREVLSDALYYIRFSMIGLKDFSMWCSPSKILSDRETVHLYDAIVSNHLESVGTKKQKLDEDYYRDDNINLATKFVSKPRAKSNLFVRVADDGKQHFCDAIPETHTPMYMTFSEDVWLKGLSVYGSSISNIIVNNQNYKLEYIKDGMALLTNPVFMEADQNHCLDFGPNYYTDVKIQSAKTYKWHGFECNLLRAANRSIYGTKVISCGGLILSIFDDQSININEEKTPFLNLTSVRVDQN